MKLSRTAAKAWGFTPTRQKFNAQRVGQFDSKKEAHRASGLACMERFGMIRDLRTHPRFLLFVRGQYIGRFTADFCYRKCDTDELIVEDVKGGRATKTEAYRLRKRIVEALYGITIREV